MADRLGRLAALARRAGTLLVIVEPTALGRGSRPPSRRRPACGSSWSGPAGSGWAGTWSGSGARCTVARNRDGPPGRRTDLEILYADGGARDACLVREELLADPARAVEPPAPPGPRATDPPPATRPKGPLHRPIPMRLLHLLWPHLPLRLARSRLESSGSDGVSASWPSGPIVLGGQPWTDGTVVDADPLARALGVRRGIPLGSAHRLAPEATFLDLAPEADRDAVEAACERLAAFSPGIAGTSDVTRAGVRADRGPGRRARRGCGDRARRSSSGSARRSARSCPGRCRPGSPGTRFAAIVAAAHAPAGGTPILVPPGDDARFLASYPPGCSRRTRTSGRAWRASGCDRSGRWRSSRHRPWSPGFGDEGARLHARARGEETEPFRPRRTPERLALGLPIDPPVGGARRRCGSSSAGSSAPWPTSSRPAAWRPAWPG